MRRTWSREHLIRRVDRYYRLAAAARQPDAREQYLSHARQYRRMLATRHATTA